jgi:O-acetyl-ADP-ribose deacetylase (regulator of RNase III)
MDVLKALLTRPFYVLVFVGGLLLLLASCFNTDIFKLQLSSPHNPIVWLFVPGLLLSLGSVALFSLVETDIGWMHSVKTVKVDGGCQAAVGRCYLRVVYGRIEECRAAESLAVVLPTNEFFDDECIRDGRSALGAYVLKNFPAGVEQIQREVQSQLQGRCTETVEKEKGVFRESYGIGASVFLDRPLSSPHRMVLVAVTKKRAGIGLRADISSVFQAVSEVLTVAAEKRLDELYFPVIGSGHGGLRNEVALFSMVLALSEALCKPSGPRLSINILVFRKNENSKPDVTAKTIRRALRLAGGMFGLEASGL